MAEYGRIHTDGSRSGGQPLLLPCPFCGGVQIKAFHHVDRGWGGTCHVQCVAEECGNSTCHHDTEAAAIAAWNTRQPTQSNVAAAGTDRIGGGGGLPCGVVGVATQSDALREALERIEAATRNEVRAGDKGYISRYGINGIARAALEQSE